MSISYSWEGKGGYGSCQFCIERVGVQIKLQDPLRTRVIAKRFWGDDSQRGAIPSVCTFTFTKLTWGTGVRGLTRGLASSSQGNQEPLVVKDKVRGHWKYVSEILLKCQCSRIVIVHRAFRGVEFQNIMCQKKTVNVAWFNCN